MNHWHWIPLAAAVGIGLSVAGVSYWLVSVIDAVPPEDRSFRDKPPAAFRLLWWPIQWTAHYLGRVLPMGYRQRTLSKLRGAGLDYALSSEQFFAGRLIFGAASAALAAWILGSFGRALQWWPLLGALGGFVFPLIWLSDQIKFRRHDTLKTLPFFLDIMTLCVEAGLNLGGAMAQAVDKGPPGTLRDEVSRVLRDVRAGKPRADALRNLADRMNESSIVNLVSVLIQAEATGMNLGPILRAQAEQRRSERFARAEKLAMEAPVKLLFPLIAFIFPCTFVVLGFPIAMKFLHMGL